MEILYFGVWCRPFHEYWAVPTDNIQCSAAVHHLITNAVFNISSDVMMMCIPLPMLISSRLPRLKKAILCILFGMGTFVIACAITNKVYSFTQPFAVIWTYWYVREASTAILVANIPNCWPLLRRLFNLRSFNGTTGETPMPQSGAKSQIKGPGHQLHSMSSPAWPDRRAGRVSKSESEEDITLEASKQIPLEIWQDTEVRVIDRPGDEAWMANGMRNMYDDNGSEKYSSPYGLTTTVVTARPSTSSDGEVRV
ncbi:MAG: hypothetical protein M1818_001060 [Claussenomyces sp. TS43310]|nr:MAG: hypothetical protein M1818_001060 [Claussenomyces sp. TS43310]